MFSDDLEFQLFNGLTPQNIRELAVAKSNTVKISDTDKWINHKSTTRYTVHLVYGETS